MRTGSTGIPLETGRPGNPPLDPPTEWSGGQRELIRHVQSPELFHASRIVQSLGQILARGWCAWSAPFSRAKILQRAGGAAGQRNQAVAEVVRNRPLAGAEGSQFPPHLGHEP